MVKYGMVNDGVECLANIRARYDGEKANPYNETEYGRHYARAMARWGAIPMLSGFLYAASARELEIKPLIHASNFSCFWSTLTGWGDFQLSSEKGHPILHLRPMRGFFELRQIKHNAKTFPAHSVKLIVGHRSVPCTVEVRGADALVMCKENIRATATAPLSIAAR
jgi:non-lysosomal glucosylceramidase